MSRYYPAVGRRSFWFVERWPREDPESIYIFLGHAVLATGKALFRATWSDDDPKKVFSGSGNIQEERERVTSVMEKLGVAIARGDVRFALRVEEGGGFKPQKESLDIRDGALVRFGKSNWNVDDLTPLFKYAQMNDGIFRPERVPPLDWIYVERQSFERFIAGLALQVQGFAQDDTQSSQHVARTETEKTPPGVATTEYQRANPSKQRIRAVLGIAHEFFNSSGFLMWTKEEAEQELKELLGASRILCREIFAETEMAQYFPGGKGRRGTPNMNRINELSQFRQNFKAANMRN